MSRLASPLSIAPNAPLGVLQSLRYFDSSFLICSRTDSNFAFEVI